MKTRRVPAATGDERGMAMLEVIPLIVIFMVIAAYSFGSFGITHTAILNSIAARTYAFETFRHRTDLTYLRDTEGSPDMFFNKIGNRVHTITSEVLLNNNDDTFYASERRIAMGLDTPLSNRDNLQVHNAAVYSIVDGRRNTTIEANPVWVKTQYGICLNARCGD